MNEREEARMFLLSLMRDENVDLKLRKDIATDFLYKAMQDGVVENELKVYFDEDSKDFAS